MTADRVGINGKEHHHLQSGHSLFYLSPDADDRLDDAVQLPSTPEVVPVGANQRCLSWSPTRPELGLSVWILPGTSRSRLEAAGAANGIARWS
jgi:hypothetical protein